jgi:hypothetical protein
VHRFSVALAAVGGAAHSAVATAHRRSRCRGGGGGGGGRRITATHTPLQPTATSLSLCICKPLITAVRPSHSLRLWLWLWLWLVFFLLLVRGRRRAAEGGGERGLGRAVMQLFGHQIRVAGGDHSTLPVAQWRTTTYAVWPQPNNQTKAKTKRGSEQNRRM